MVRLGIIEESLADRQILDELRGYFVSQRIQAVLGDEFPLWHVNEYHVDDNKLETILDILGENIKETWYCHGFNNKKLYVVLCGKWFEISLEKDDTWDEMVYYGVENARVEREYLENIPLEI